MPGCVSQSNVSLSKEIHIRGGLCSAWIYHHRCLFFCFKMARIVSFLRNITIIVFSGGLPAEQEAQLLKCMKAPFPVYTSAVSIVSCMNRDVFVITGLRQPSAGSPLCLCSWLLLVIVSSFLPVVVVTMAVWGEKGNTKQAKAASRLVKWLLVA